MKGVQFVVDDSGKKKAVLIDLEEWGEIWEDFYDALISESRKNEPTVPWSELKAEMEQGEHRVG
jgi:hypothetical protein